MTVATPSLYAVCDEFGVARNTPFPSGFYGKPGFPSSGPFSLQQCVGLSSVTFTPNGGTVTGTGSGSASATITCSQPAVWTYSGGGVGGSINVASGATASSIMFTVTNVTATDRELVWTLTGVAGGVTRNFTVDVTAYGTGQ